MQSRCSPVVVAGAQKGRCRGGIKSRQRPRVERGRVITLPGSPRKGGGVEFSTGSVASVVRGRPEGGASAARVAESAAASALPAWGRGTQSSRGACYQYTRSPGDTEQRRTRSGQPGAPAAGGSAAAGGSDCAAGGGASPGSAGASAGSGVVYGTCSNSAVRCFARSPRRS